MRIGYVFDDDVLFQLLAAIEESRTISFDYTNQAQIEKHFTDILPVKIISVENIGRRYLFALNLFCEEHLSTLFLLDNISYIEPQQISSAYTHEEKEEIYHKSVHFSAGSLHINTAQLTCVHLIYDADYEKQLTHYLPDAELSSDESGIHHARVNVVNIRELRPFLRQCAEWIKPAPDDTSGLAEELTEEAAKWRALYGIIS